MIENTVNNNGHNYVDLNLPSGTLWSICNVGANKLTDAGLYFQWGDIIGYSSDQIGNIEGKKAFNWSSYKFLNSNSDESFSDESFTKYTKEGDVLDLEDDAAHIFMHGAWHMPSPSQIQELIDNTTTSLITLNDVDGIIFISKKDSTKFIFFPMTGSIWDGSLYYNGKVGSIWSSALSNRSFYYARRLYFNSEEANLISASPRYGGVSVRGVIG